jgi:DNA-binding MarR family transcriptional regulator
MIATNHPDPDNDHATSGLGADGAASAAASVPARADGSAPTPSPAPAEGPGAPYSLTAQQAARRVARAFPEVYRRYHWANKVHDGDLPVTRRALEVLQHLEASGPLTVGEQAAHLGLRRNSVSELLKRLEDKGLVARIRDERDERRVLVWLTQAGRDVVSRVGQVLAPDLLATVMESLTPDERAAVVRGFELIAAANWNPEQPRAGSAGRAATTERNPR